MTRGTVVLAAGLVVFGCGDNGGGDASASATGTTTTATTDTTTTTATTGDVVTGTATGTTGGGSDSVTVASDPTTTDATLTGTSTTTTTDATTGTGTSTTATTGSTGDPLNSPPEWTSEPETDIVLTEIYQSEFEPGRLYLSSSRTDEIRVYNAKDLTFIEAFTHPAFSKINSPLNTYGPNGAAFNERGNLVVAAYDTFVEFSDHGVEYATYPKAAAEATENIIFDYQGNLYTTTSTGGTDKLNQYAAKDYAFVKTIPLPQGAGQLTGITFDGYGRLYLASQSDNSIHVTDINADFVNFTWVKKLSGAGNPGNLEGLQFNANGQLVAAAGDLVRYDVNNNVKLGTFDDPGDAFPVPLRVDNEGNIYTSDYENGSGTLPADIFKFAPDGQFLNKANDPGLYGPFGLALSGTVLAGDPPVKWSYMLAATDPDGDPLTYALVQGPPDMTLDQNLKTLTWFVTSEDIGMYDIVLEVSDGQGGVTPQMFTLIVSAA
jgi:hypothetical protein